MTVLERMHNPLAWPLSSGDNNGTLYHGFYIEIYNISTNILGNNCLSSQSTIHTVHSRQLVLFEENLSLAPAYNPQNSNVLLPKTIYRYSRHSVVSRYYF